MLMQAQFIHLLMHHRCIHFLDLNFHEHHIVVLTADVHVTHRSNLFEVIGIVKHLGILSVIVIAILAPVRIFYNYNELELYHAIVHSLIFNFHTI